MAYNYASALFLISLLFAASNPLANGQILTLRGLSVTGRLCCTPTGNCPGQGVNGALVRLNCTILGSNVTVGQGTTNVNGNFNITVGALTGLILGLPTLPCVAVVQLPLNNVVCPVLSTTNGVLASALQSVGTVVTSLLGLVQNFVLNGFFRISA
ncbi:hypothetical protein BUALT_Bualt12G0044300 [Buddleja alternifolia]|uniref:Uncharacterized protein n=1 Tax=Buddleja alternifolia TaxID=168488 RepID=A0AAV6WNC3_9LAMI|nr:hypothetical protein BUALT_Bualt12G0044300 [Buddleja alternifolia]